VPSTETRVEVAIGLVYQSGDLHAHLREALRDSGASIVYETETAAFDRAALARSGAQVVIVNLDPDSDEQLEAIDDLLVDDAIKVVFNDGEVSSKLAGYDLARWARHLAAKIVGDAELLPPRPVGAEAVPVRSMPQHALTTTHMPKSLDAPSVSDDSMRHATDAIANALASFDMHATKLEAKNAPGADDLSALLGDFGLTDSASPAASTTENPFADLGLALDLSEPAPAATPASPRAERAEPPAQLEDELLAFADLDFSEPAAVAGAAEGLDDLLAKQAPRPEAGAPASASNAPAAAERAPRSNLLDELTLSLEPQDDAPAAAAPASTAAAVEFDFPFDLDGLTLEPLDDAPAAPPAKAATSAPPSAPAAQPTRAAAPTVEDNPFADLGLSLEPLDGAPVAAVAPTAPAAANTAAASPFDGLDFALEDLSSGAGDAATTADVGISASLDETLELSVGNIGLGSNESAAASSTEEDDFMREFAAMTAVAEATPVGPVVNSQPGAIRRVWVLGASIGGPDAVREFLTNIPASVQACFVLAQHMGADFVDLMVTQLQKATPMPVAIASAGMRAGHGQVLVAPIAERMLLDPSGEVKVVALDEASPYSPSIDRVLIDIADRFGADAGAIVFSGMAHDAIEGAKRLAAKGGSVWVQDPATCVVSSMIDGAMEAGIVSFIGTPVDLAAEFVRRFGKA